MTPRLGTYATIAGVEYEADSLPADGSVTVFARAASNPAPLLLGPGPSPDLWVATVPTSSCERVYSVTTRASWRGEPCQVMSVADGYAVIYHVGDNRARAVSFGFRPLMPGTYAQAVPVSELEDYHEVRTDLLFEEWSR
jgi:hypothetical protein